MSSKYCLKSAFLQNVGKLFSLWIIHLGKENRFWLCTTSNCMQAKHLSFPSEITEHQRDCEGDGRQRRREIQEDNIFSVHQTKFYIYLVLHIIKGKVNEYCKPLSRLSTRKVKFYSSTKTFHSSLVVSVEKLDSPFPAPFVKTLKLRFSKLFKLLKH